MPVTPTSRRTRWLVALLLIGWATSVVLAFWWYQGRYVQRFGDQPALFYGQHLALPKALMDTSRIRVVHFHNPACPCEQATQIHLAELLKRFAGKVDFFVLTAPGTQAMLEPALNTLPQLHQLPGSEHLPASPSVAIWDTQNHLAYLGPYSEGAVCSIDGSLIEPVLDALLTGRQVSASSTLASACLCPWPQ